MTKNEKLRKQLNESIAIDEDFITFAMRNIKTSKNNRLIIMTYKEWDEFIGKINRALEHKLKSDNALYRTIKECTEEEKTICTGAYKNNKYIQVFKCPDCGKIMHYEFYNFCPHCGTKLDWNDEKC